jgi:hypothetical protein
MAWGYDGRARVTGYRAAAATIEVFVTGDVTVALIATPTSPSGIGAITQELDATFGLIAVPEMVASAGDTAEAITAAGGGGGP